MTAVSVEVSSKDTAHVCATDDSDVSLEPSSTRKYEYPRMPRRTALSLEPRSKDTAHVSVATAFKITTSLK